MYLTAGSVLSSRLGNEYSKLPNSFFTINVSLICLYFFTQTSLDIQVIDMVTAVAQWKNINENEFARANFQVIEIVIDISD